MFNGRRSGSLSISSLQNKESALFNGEFDVLNFAKIFLETIQNLSQLFISFGQLIC